MLTVAAALGASVVVAAVLSLELQRRRIDPSEPGFLTGWAVTLTAAFSLTLVQAHHLIGDSTAKRAVLLAPLVLCIAYCRLHSHRRLAPLATWLLVTFAALFVVTMWRGAHAEGHGMKEAMTLAVTVLTVLAFAILLHTSARDDLERHRRLVAVALAPVIYITANVVLHLAGFESNSVTSVIGETNSLGSHLGITSTRLVPPLGDNVNSFGAITGAAIASSLLLWRHRVIAARYALPALAMCAYAIALTDSRTALAAGVLVGLFVRPTLRLARWAPIVIPVSPLIVLYLPEKLGGFVSGLARSSEDLTTGNSRLYIWRPAWNFISHAPLTDTMIGWGAHGQRTSGVSAYYAYLFSHITNDPTSITTHNLFLQTVLDMGWIGLAILIWLLVVAIGALRATGHTPLTAVAGILIVLVLAGMTEALPTYNFPETITLMVLVVGTALVPVSETVSARRRIPRWQRQVQRIERQHYRAAA